MRKYRAWDTLKKEYLPEQFLNQLFLRQDGKVFWWSYEGFADVTDRYKLEFFTGLKDKNGTEIYEGDIVTTPRYKCKAQLQVYWNEETAAFEGLHPKEIGGSECFDEITEPEVIGNIHQNPELMEQE